MNRPMRQGSYAKRVIRFYMRFEDRAYSRGVAMANEKYKRLNDRYPDLDAQGLTALGDFYFEGKVTEKDYVRSFALYSEAAAKGSDEAKILLMERVDQCSQQTEIVKRSELEDIVMFEKLASEYLEEMAKKGHTPSLLKLGTILVSSGPFDAPDESSKRFKEGERYLMQALGQGELEAGYTLGVAHSRACPSTEKTISIFASSALKGHEPSLDAILELCNPSNAYGLRSKQEYDRWMKIKESFGKGP
jgi:TPR repeat protein